VRVGEEREERKKERREGEDDVVKDTKETQNERKKQKKTQNSISTSGDRNTPPLILYLKLRNSFFLCRPLAAPASCSPAVNGSLSLTTMCPAISFHPFRAPKDAKMSAEPMVNVRANLDGVRMIMGRKTKKARRRKRTPAPKSAAK
jgi:hypothetical protein